MVAVLFFFELFSDSSLNLSTSIAMFIIWTTQKIILCLPYKLHILCKFHPVLFIIINSSLNCYVINSNRVCICGKIFQIKYSMYNIRFYWAKVRLFIRDCSLVLYQTNVGWISITYPCCLMNWKFRMSYILKWQRLRIRNRKYYFFCKGSIANLILCSPSESFQKLWRN